MISIGNIAKFIILILVIAFISHLILTRIYAPVKVNFGVTFSSRYAKYLKLDWRDTFRKILVETETKSLRLPLYWEDIEPQPDRFNFTDADFMISLAGEKAAKIIIVLGMKQPRWPECHIPTWAKQLTVAERQDRALRFIDKVVTRYHSYPHVWAWQVENEPLLPFGEGCDNPDKNFLKKEVGLVRSLSNKTIIMTDSGELGSWVTAMQLSDVFGTTLYRQVYDKLFGYITYPVPPYFYNIKSTLVRQFFAQTNKKTIILELQTEPWLAEGNFIPADQQAKTFTAQNWKDYIGFAQKTGFDEAYLWGAEWWYFMEANGHPEYLENAKTLFSNQLQR